MGGLVKAFGNFQNKNTVNLIKIRVKKLHKHLTTVKPVFKFRANYNRPLLRHRFKILNLISYSRYKTIFFFSKSFFNVRIITLKLENITKLLKLLHGYKFSI